MDATECLFGVYEDIKAPSLLNTVIADVSALRDSKNITITLLINPPKTKAEAEIFCKALRECGSVLALQIEPPKKEHAAGVEALLNILKEPANQPLVVQLLEKTGKTPTDGSVASALRAALNLETIGNDFVIDEVLAQLQNQTLAVDKPAAQAGMPVMTKQDALLAQIPEPPRPLPKNTSSAVMIHASLAPQGEHIAKVSQSLKNSRENLKKKSPQVNSKPNASASRKTEETPNVKATVPKGPRR